MKGVLSRYLGRASAIDELSSLLGQTKLYWSLVLIFLIAAWFSPVDGEGGNIFMSMGNLTDILRQVSITGIMAIGMTLVILIGGIDLSVGTVMALGSTICAMLLTQQEPSNASLIAQGSTILLVGLGCTLAIKSAARRLTDYSIPLPISTLTFGLVSWGLYSLFVGQYEAGVSLAAIVLGNICIGLLIGAAAGLIISYGRLQSFIVTLAMMSTVLGLARLIAGPDTSVYPIYSGINAPETFDWLRESYFGVPFSGLLFLSLALAFWILLSRFRFGRCVYAIGSNERAAYLSGINVNQVKVVVFALSSMLAMLAGVLYAAQYRQGKPDAGTGLELDVIAAVVIGGSSLLGGKGSVQGTVVGVLIFGMLSNFLQLKNIDSNTQLVLKGCIIVSAVLIQEGNVSGLLKRLGRR